MPLELMYLLLLLLLPLFFLLLISKKSKTQSPYLPKSYPLIGSYISLMENKDRRLQWISDILQSSPSATFVLNRPLGHRSVFTANPANVQHILKTHFHIYHKGKDSHQVLFDFLGDGIFNTDGETWKFQRQIASHEFNTKSLRNFVEHVVDTELSGRMIPILSTAAADKTVLDLQDILQRFAFDNICKIAFGYDPEFLLPTLPPAEFVQAFEFCVKSSIERFTGIFPFIWKIKRFFNVGSEKELRVNVSKVRDFAKNIIKEKKEELRFKKSLESVDILSRFLSSGHSDENFVTDVIISFIMAGRDTTSAALTWFFWLVSQNPKTEHEILKEITEKTETMTAYDEAKEMSYTHAALCETMRLYPPVPVDTKMAMEDDVLPDGTAVKKGMRVTYHPYAMGRLEELWGPDWEEFKPERWLEKDTDTKKWKFVGRDPYTYPVFQAGPRICLGKEMAFLQMKRVVAGVLRRFKVVPAAEDGVDPVFISYLTGKMKGGFPVRIEEREELVAGAFADKWGICSSEDRERESQR
ncbi:cytochrome P450 94A2-like [Tripterygium wilfordii]|uniref:cytochrome P450 94A2-like n=1 Tax=Tripterygium wilfordii TaxID=458696 RepID=UPI0018F84336|nr:cytochrome P450 94A2-like [Tripterygium wilfordii]